MTTQEEELAALEPVTSEQRWQARTLCAIECVGTAFWGGVTALAFTAPVGWWFAAWLVSGVLIVASVVFHARWVIAARAHSYWIGRLDGFRRGRS